MSAQLPHNRAPRFKAGDAIVIVTPGDQKGRSGVVVQVLPHSGDFVHRYDIQFPDNSVSRYFGFELEFALTESA